MLAWPACSARSDGKSAPSAAAGSGATEATSARRDAAVTPSGPVLFCGKEWPADTREVDCRPTELGGYESADPDQLRDLGGPSHLSNLRELDLNNAENIVVDLEPISKLRRLEHLTTCA